MSSRESFEKVFSKLDAASLNELTHPLLSRMPDGRYRYRFVALAY